MTSVIHMCGIEIHSACPGEYALRGFSVAGASACLCAKINRSGIDKQGVLCIILSDVHRAMHIRQR